MGMFPYICQECGGGDERCCSDECEEVDCEGGQFCWSESAICVIDDIKLDEKWMTKEQMEIYQKIYDTYKGKPLMMTYDGGAGMEYRGNEELISMTEEEIKFVVDCEGLDWADSDYGLHVKAWCYDCWGRYADDNGSLAAIVKEEIK